MPFTNEIAVNSLSGFCPSIVAFLRPDLNNQQALKVLDTIQDRALALDEVSPYLWDLLEEVAQCLYPQKGV